MPHFPGLLCDRRSSVHPHPQPTRGTADAQAAHHRLARGYLLSGVALAWLDRDAESVASSVVHGRLVAVERGVEAVP